MSDGWIKLHRRTIEWGWYKDANTFRLFMHLLIKAQHKDGEYMGKSLKAGDVVYGHSAFAEQLGLSVQQVRTSFNKLKSTSEITSTAHSKFSIVSIVKWQEYQFDQQPDQQALNKQVTSRQQASNTIQECNNDKNEKKEEVLRAFKMFQDFAEVNGLSVPASLNKQRESKLRARLASCGGIEGWEHAISKLKGSGFCMGLKTDFKANLDFILQESSFAKLMEGAYDDNEPARKQSGNHMVEILRERARSKGWDT